MHPIDILIQEHRAIENMLDRLEEQIRAKSAERAFPRAFFDEALDFFRNFADGCHHAKEEHLLFPKIKARGIAEGGGPIGCMLAEHEQGRAYLKGVRENLDAAERGSREAGALVYANAAGYLALLRQHIQKEDGILFRMARAVLQPEDVAELTREFAAVPVPERFHEAATAR